MPMVSRHKCQDKANEQNEVVKFVHDGKAEFVMFRVQERVDLE